MSARRGPFLSLPSIKPQVLWVAILSFWQAAEHFNSGAVLVRTYVLGTWST